MSARVQNVSIEIPMHADYLIASIHDADLMNPQREIRIRHL